MAPLSNGSSLLTPQSRGHSTWDWPDADEDEVQIVAVKPRTILEKPKVRQEYLDGRFLSSRSDTSYGSLRRSGQDVYEDFERQARKRMKLTDRMDGMTVPKPSGGDVRPPTLRVTVSPPPRRTIQPLQGVPKPTERRVLSNCPSSETQVGPAIDLTRQELSTKMPHTKSLASSTNVKRSLAPSNAKRAFPFLEDDSSDDKTPPARPESTLQHSVRAPNDIIHSKTLPKDNAAQKEAQRQESTRLRREALKRKNSIAPSNRGFKTPQPAVPNPYKKVHSQIPPECDEVTKEDQRQRSSRLRQEAIERRNSHAPMGVGRNAPLQKTANWLEVRSMLSGPRTLEELEKARARMGATGMDFSTSSSHSLKSTDDTSQTGPRLSSPFTFVPDSKRKKAIDAKPQNLEQRDGHKSVSRNPPSAKDLYANLQERQNVNSKTPMTLPKHDAEPVQPIFSLNQFLSNPPSVKEDKVPNTGSGDPDAERLRQLRIQNLRRYSANLEGQIKANAEAERKAEAEQAEEARKTAEAKHRAEAEEKTQAEIKKEAYRKAQKKADEQREAEARQREQEKNEAQERQYVEMKKQEEARRDAARKRAQQMEREQVVVNERHAALAKIAQANAEGKKKAEMEMKADASGMAINVQAQHPPKQDLPNISFTQRAAQPPGTSNRAVAPSTTVERARKYVQAIQNKNSKPQHAEREAEKGSNSTRDAREQRIQAKKERNARIRQAEQEHEDEDQVTPEEPTLPAFQALRQGPQSLNSRAGQALLARAKLPKKTDRQAVVRTTSENDHITTPKGKYGRKSLGEILPEDMKLLKLRHGGLSWPDITFAYERAYGVKRTSNTLRLRHKQIQDALDVVRADQAIVALAVAGDDGARRRLNSMIHERWPVDGLYGRENSGRFLPDHAAKSHASASLRPPAPTTRTAYDTHQSSPSYDSSFESRNSTELTIPDPYPVCPVPGSARPRHGGKTMNEAAFRHYLEGIYEDLNQEAEEKEALAERELSPMTTDDYCHFGYQVERRELSTVEIEDGIEIDMKPWLVCCDPFDNLGEANVEAHQELLRTPRGMPPVAVGNYRIQHDDSVDKHSFLTLEGNGVVQVRVKQFMRTYQDGVLPESKDCWAPKNVYFVKEKTTKESMPTANEDLDELFQETTKITIERLIEDTTYTTLELANMCAVKEFVRTTFMPKSGHLRQRDLEIQDEEQRLMQELGEAEGEETMFSKEGSGKSGAVVSIFVEKGRLAGPRNLD